MTRRLSWRAAIALPLTTLCLTMGCAQAEDHADLSTEDDRVQASELGNSTFFPLVTKGAMGTTSITYQNLASADNEVSFSIIDQSGTEVASYQGVMTPNAGLSRFLGHSDFGLPAGFVGSAIVRSEHPIAATAVQTQLANRPMYDGMSRNLAAPSLWAPASDPGGTVTLVAAQNITKRTLQINGQSIAPGESMFMSGGDQARALEADGMIVGVAFEQSSPNTVVATEAVRPAITTSMAIAQCRRDWGTHSFYELHNPTDLAATAKVVFRGKFWNADDLSTLSTSVQVPAGNTVKVDTCDTTGDGFNGGATIDSSLPIASTGEVRHFSKPGHTGFVGADVGAAELVLPYVRWWPDAVSSRQRTYIAVSNTTDVSVNADVKYYDARGGLVRSHSMQLGPYEKANSYACIDISCSSNSIRKFGNPEGNQANGAGSVWGGSVVVSSRDGSASLLATARTRNALASATLFDSEDYNGVDADIASLVGLPSEVIDDVVALIDERWNTQIHHIVDAADEAAIADKVGQEQGRQGEEVSVQHFDWTLCCNDRSRTATDFYGVVAAGAGASQAAEAALKIIRDSPNDLAPSDPRGFPYDFDSWVTWDPPAFGATREQWEGAYLDLWGPLLQDNSEIDYIDADISDRIVCAATLTTKLAGIHPVSGIRCWGWEPLPDIGGQSAVLLFTTGLDTPNNSLSQWLAVPAQDGTWQSMMRDTGDFLADDHGLAVLGYHRIVHRYTIADSRALREQKKDQRTSDSGLDLSPWIDAVDLDELQSTRTGYFPAP